MDLSATNCLALPRASLLALRAALIRDTGGSFATFLQEAGYAGGEAVFGAFRAWVAARGEDVEALDVPGFQARATEFFREAGWGSITVAAVADVVALVDSTDWAEADPIGQLAGLWQAYRPQMQDYLTRALDPTAAPSYGVPGDE